MAQLILLILGALLVAFGVAWIFPPLGVIVAGLGLCAYALFWDFGGSR